jgi:hypothetical protein
MSYYVIGKISNVERGVRKGAWPKVRAFLLISRWYRIHSPLLERGGRGFNGTLTSQAFSGW